MKKNNLLLIYYALIIPNTSFSITFKELTELITYDKHYHDTLSQGKIPDRPHLPYNKYYEDKFAKKHIRSVLINFGIFTWPSKEWMDTAFEKNIIENYKCKKGLEVAAGNGLISDLIQEHYSLVMTATDPLPNFYRKVYKRLDTDEKYLAKIEQLTAHKAVEKYSDENDFLFLAYIDEQEADIEAVLNIWSSKDKKNNKPILVLGRDSNLKTIHSTLTRLGYMHDNIEKYSTPLTNLKESAILYHKLKIQPPINRTHGNGMTQD